MKIKMDPGKWKPYCLHKEEVERLREGLLAVEKALREEFEAERQRNVMPEGWRDRIIR